MDTQNINTKKLFLMSCVALIVTAISFALRARLEPIFMTDYGLSATDIGFAFGPAFYGFTISMILFGSFVDSWGMKKVLTMAFILHAIGITGTIFSTGMWSLFFSTAAIGVGNGAIEAACNPLVASLYPQNKATMLNRFHVWFPGGIVIGSLIAYFMLDVSNMDWRLYVAVLYIPLVIYGIMFLKENFPQTERVTSGVTTAEMWKSLSKPIFIFMSFCMLLTAVTELATQQRISTLLADANAIPMLVLALTTGLMALGRAFAGPVVHKLSTSGTFIFSCYGIYRFAVIKPFIGRDGLFFSGNFRCGSLFLLAYHAWICRRRNSSKRCVRFIGNWRIRNVFCFYCTSDNGCFYGYGNTRI